MNYFIFTMALWRLVSLFANETGPFRVFQGIRDIVWKLDNRFAVLHRFRLHEGFTCEWCLSIWIGVSLFILWYIYGEPVLQVLFPFAASTGVIVIKYVVQTLEQLQVYYTRKNE
jgi:hypothetical protein